MKNRGLFFLLTFALVSLVLKSQERVVVEVYPNQNVYLDYEKLDLKDYNAKFSKSGSLDYSYIKPDGTQIRITCQRKGQNIEVYEIPPTPVMYRVFKEFYPNGSLKTKGLYFPQQFPIGKWVEYSPTKELSVIDYESDRPGVGYNGVLDVLAEYGIDTIDSEWILNSVWFSDTSQEWGIKLSKDAFYKIIMMDSSSGEIKNEFDNIPNQDY